MAFPALIRASSAFAMSFASAGNGSERPRSLSATAKYATLRMAGSPSGVPFKDWYWADVAASMVEVSDLRSVMKYWVSRSRNILSKIR